MQYKYYWTELIGFDNQSEDYGVAAFTETKRDVYGVVLLFSCVDFYVNPRGGDRRLNSVLYKEDCSYLGHEYNEERRRQDWTHEQLKGLVAALHERKIKVYCTVFDPCISGGEFITAHPEVAAKMYNGISSYVVDVLSEMSDGRQFGEFLADKVVETLNYYGFDGAHLADGISTPRFTVQLGDYGDRSVALFNEFSGGAYASDLEDNCDGMQSKLIKRYRYIRANLDKEWLDFCVHRFAEYFNMFAGKVAAAEKKIIFHNAWLRDPFESIIRYGFDLRKLNYDCVEALTLCDVNRRMLSKRDLCNKDIPVDERKYYELDTPAVMLTTKAVLPDVRQFSLSPLKDTREQWNVLRHSPTSAVSKAVRRNSQFYYDGEYKLINDGLIYCLSDAIDRNDWSMLEAAEDISRIEGETPAGLMLLWSDAALDKEVEAYFAARTPSTFALIKKLHVCGLPLSCVSRFESLDKAELPVLCCFARNFTSQERERLNSFTRVPLVILDSEEPLRRKADYVIKGDGLSCYLYNVERKEPCVVPHKNKRMVHKPGYEAAGGIWIRQLGYEGLNPKFFKALAAELQTLLKLPSLKQCDDCKLSVKCVKGGYKLFLDNFGTYYSQPEIVMPQKIKQVSSVMKGNLAQLSAKGNKFIDKVPALGCDLVEVKTEKDDLC